MEWIEVNELTTKQIPQGVIIIFKDEKMTHVGEKWGDKFLHMAGCHLIDYTQECIREVTHWIPLPK